MPLVLAALLTLAAPDAASAAGGAPAADPLKLPEAPEGTLTDIHDLPTFGLWAAGGVTGFVAHELGHVLANFSFGNTPTLIGLKGFGFIPFFAISPQISCFNGRCVHDDGTSFAPGPPGMYTISSAGFDVQHISSEVMLSVDPDLRYQVAPYRKGWLAFNVLLSVGYAVSAFFNVETNYGDVGGSANAAGIDSNLYASLLLVPAALDTYRYLVPDTVWAPWVSRATKLTFIGIAFAI